MSADLPDTLAGLLSRWRERYRTDPSFRDEIGMLFQVLRGIEGDLDGVALDRAAGAGRTSGELPPDESALFLTDAIRAVPLGASTGTPSEGPRVAGSPAETVPPPPRPFTEKEVEELQAKLLASRNRAPITADGQPIEAPGSFPSPLGDDDLRSIEVRCAMKAEGCRWAAERTRRIESAADYATDVEPYDREIIRRAREIPDCYLWMNTPEAPTPENLRQLEDTADAFDACASVASLVRHILVDPVAGSGNLEEALDLLAEAQSTLRMTVQTIQGPYDPDQKRIYTWLREITAREQIYIRRHMRVDDPGDPRRLPELHREINDLQNRVSSADESRRKQKAGFNTIRYHARRIVDGGGQIHDWKRIMESIDESLALGMARSHPELRNLILPIVDRVPADLDPTPGLAGVLQEIDRFLGTRGPAIEPRDREITEEIRRVRSLLGGRSIVVLGGSRRPASQSALRESLELREVYWPDSREHQSIEPFASWIDKDDVALVLLAIRWSSHSFGDVKVFCDRSGKPLVRLPSGYSPNQVAVQILQQASGALAKSS